MQERAQLTIQIMYDATDEDPPGTVHDLARLFDMMCEGRLSYEVLSIVQIGPCSEGEIE